MMKRISNPAELVSMINEGETQMLSSTPNKKKFNTVILNRDNNEHYRIEWGKVKDENGVEHIFFNPNLTCVKFNSKVADWLSAEERKLSRDLDSENEFPEGTLFFMNGETRSLEELADDTCSVVSGLAGSGKSRLVCAEIAKHLKNREHILLFSLDGSGYSVVKGVIRELDEDLFYKVENDEFLTEDEVKDLEDISHLMDNYLFINSSTEICTDYIIQEAKKEKELNDIKLLVVDSLSLVQESDENVKLVKEIHSHLNQLRQEVDCNILVTTQMKSRGFDFK